ncbi:MAG: oligosaccharide flippase family protein [Isosphaeraceae bacterium]
MARRLPQPGMPQRVDAPVRRRIASNFAFLSVAELICRTTSVLVMLYLAKTLGVESYGRIEFAFNVVFWLVLLLRDSSDYIVTRELSRHPRLISPLVDHVLAFKSMFALVLFTGLTFVGSLTLRESTDRTILSLYGLMLFTAAIGLDYVYRGTERMGLVAISLCVRTGIYAIGVYSLLLGVTRVDAVAIGLAGGSLGVSAAGMGNATRVVWVPIWLTIGEFTGIALVWGSYLRSYRMPRPRLGLRFLSIIVQRGRKVCLMQLSQAMINVADLLVVGFFCSWADIGRYGAPHRLSTALLTFGLILQQAAFPTLARLWRQTACAGRQALDSLVEVLVTGLLPVAVGCTVLSDSLVHLFLNTDYKGAGFLLAVGIWRAPLLILAYLYQTTLIALNREAVGVRALTTAALGIWPLVALLRWWFGLPGASVGVLLVGLALVVIGYASLAREGRQPAWHHHLGRPILGCLAMVPVCLSLQRYDVRLAILGGAATYIAVWLALGGMGNTRSWRAILGPSARS